MEQVWRVASKLGAFLRRDALNQLSYKLALVSQLAALLSSALTVYFLARMVESGAPAALGPYAGSYFAFALLGLVVADSMAVALRGFGAAVRSAMVEGQLEAMLATPTSPAIVVVGSGLHAFAWTAMRSVALLVLGAALGASWAGARWDVAAVAVSLVGVSAVSLGLVAAALTLVYKKGEPVTAAMAGATLLLGGVLYPVTSLPGWLQPVAWALPPTHAIEVVRLAVLRGAGFTDASRPLLTLVLQTAVLMPVGALALKWAVARLEEDGSADQF